MASKVTERWTQLPSVSDILMHLRLHAKQLCTVITFSLISTKFNNDIVFQSELLCDNRSEENLQVSKRFTRMQSLFKRHGQNWSSSLFQLDGCCFFRRLTFWNIMLVTPCVKQKIVRVKYELKQRYKGETTLCYPLPIFMFSNTIIISLHRQWLTDFFKVVLGYL